MKTIQEHIGSVKPEQEAIVRQIVAASGWPGLRQQRPDLWQIIEQNRRDSRRFVDATIDRD